MWLRLAAAQRPENAAKSQNMDWRLVTERDAIAQVMGAQHTTEGAVKHRDRIARLMTPTQIAEAQKLAREWRPITQPSTHY